MGSIRVIAEVMPLVKENLGVKADIIRLCFVASWLRVRHLALPQRGCTRDGLTRRHEATKG